jgi:hypothetical protein
MTTSSELRHSSLSFTPAKVLDHTLPAAAQRALIATRDTRTSLVFKSDMTDARITAALWFQRVAIVTGLAVLGWGGLLRNIWIVSGGVALVMIAAALNRTASSSK